MKKFFDEFKKFINRGNVLDLAVGVIIGGAFTAIVTALTTHILSPLINGAIYVLFGGTSNKPVYTVLVGAYTEDGALDTANSIFINWGAFLSAIINFILVALVLFIIIKAINKVQETNQKLVEGIKSGKLTKEEKKELKKRGVSLKDKEKVAAFIEEKKAAEQEEKKKAAEKEEEAKRHTTEGLLEDIKALLEKRAEK